MGIDWESLLGAKKDEKKKQPEQATGAKPTSAPTPTTTQQPATTSITQTTAQQPPQQPAPQPTRPQQSQQPQQPTQQPTQQKADVATTLIKEVLKPVEEQKTTEEDLLAEEPAQPAKEVWLIFGDKGTGKTTTALSFPGELLVLSFDRKSAIIKHNMYSNDPRIHVFDVVKLMDYSSPEKMVESANRTFEYINTLLDTYTKKYPQPDWVVIDGAQIFQQICEWTMRYRHNLGPFDGIANLNLWKERRMYIRQVHNKALNLAKRGIIYTTYVEKDEVIIKGEVVTRKDTPAWIDVLIYETDYVLYTSYDESKKTYHVRVVSSKNDKRIRSGAEFDVTNRRFSEYVSWS